jgi:uncharacterized repeat protein (TIGR01451 family)
MKVFHRLILLTTAFLFTQISLAQLFGEQQVISTEADGAQCVYTADLDGDGDMDVLSASSWDDKIAWYENQGEGLFSDQQIISTDANHALSVHSADLDDDGDMDVLSASISDQKIAWYENLGGGFFSNQQIISVGENSAQSVFAADLDSDGDLDVLVGFTFSVSWFENIGGGLFGDQQIISVVPYGAVSVYSTDLEGDGDMDVLTAFSEEGLDLISWYENEGGGIFDNQQIIFEETIGANSVYASDLDGDGDMDVLSTSGWDDTIAWYENQGGGLFSDQQIITTATDGPRSVIAGDLDGDGDPDVISGSSGDDKIAWHENLGGGNFGERQIITSQVDIATNVNIADLDGDGDMDVLSASDADNKIAWYENLSGEGCMDPDACNYDPEVWIENNTCCYECGCTVIGAVNYSSTACLNDGSCQFEVIGAVFFDENENGIMDGDESGLSLQEVELLPNNMILTTNDDGHFLVDASGSEEYTFTLAENPLFPFFITPQTLTVDATQDNWNQDTLYFGVSNEFPAFDLEAGMYQEMGGFPCNDERAYYLCFRNTSNVSMDIQLEFQYDTLFQDIIESAEIDSLGENLAYLSFTDVAPMELICAEVEVVSPTVEFIGAYLDTYFEVTAFYDGVEVAFGADLLSEELTCAYDPNDKQVYPVGYAEEHYIANDTLLEYLIRFQNTGNAPATDVTIRDTLDQNLNISTFELAVSSHSVFTTLNPETREVEFYFQNIMLPDSVNNEPESHGLVSFTIRPEADLPLLTELKNTAAIYFDNNPPIITNTTWSTIYDCSLFEVSFNDDGALLTASEGDNYQWFLNDEPIEGATEQEYTATENGNYSVQVDIDFPCSEMSSSTFIVVTSVDDWKGKEVKLFPNPLTTSAILDVGELSGTARVEVYDISGKLQRSELLSLDSGSLILERGALSAGTYILRLTQGEEAMELKFVVGE